MLDTTLWVIQHLGPWGLVALIFVKFVVVLADEDRTAIWRARLYKYAYRVTGKTEHEKKYIANDVRGRLNLARRGLCPGRTVPAQAIEVVWVEGGAGAAHAVREGEFIVRLDPSTGQERNIAILASAIVRRTTLVGIRHSVEKALQTAIDLELVRHLLGQARNNAALDWFLENEYVPLSKSDDQTKLRNRQIVELDERGLFTRVLLVELEDFSRRIHGLPPRPYMAGEVEGLIEFLHRIATKQFGQNVPLSFDRAFIRVGFIIVAKTAKILASIEPYMGAMQLHLEKELYSIYVLAFDKEWLGELDSSAEKQFEEALGRLGHELERGSVATKDFDVEYRCVDQSGRRRRARCIRYLGPEA